MFNLSESIRDLAGRRDFAAPSEGRENLEGVSFDAIGSVVRELFVDQEIIRPEASVPIVAGALLIAAELAHDAADPVEAALTPPWEMSDPLLLDPVMWMVCTAAQQARMGMVAGG